MTLLKSSLPYLIVFALLCYIWQDRSEDRRIRDNNETLLYNRIFSELELSRSEFIKYSKHQDSLNKTLQVLNIQPGTVTHYTTVDTRFRDTLITSHLTVIDSVRNVRTFETVKGCIKSSGIVYPDSIISVIDVISPLNVVEYRNYERKTRIGQLIHLNWRYSTDTKAEFCGKEVPVIKSIEVKQ